MAATTKAEQILTLIRLNPDITARQIEIRLGLPPHTAHTSLQFLRRRNLVIQTGRGQYFAPPQPTQHTMSELVQDAFRLPPPL